MVTNDEIKKIIERAFEDFIKLYEEKYQPFYQEIGKDEKNFERYSFNPWLLTEATLKVKFGGMIETRSLNEKLDLVVNSELKVFEKFPRKMADLTIHKLTNKLWTKKNDIIESLVAVIEIKYANYANPYFDFDMEYLKNDIEKLNSLSQSINKYLIIFDEGKKLENNNKKVKDILFEAKKGKIKILSNNNIITN